MSWAELLRRLLAEGRMHFSGPIRCDVDEENEVVAFLDSAFRDYRLTVAGPPLDFDRQPGLASARFVAWAGWYLVNRGAPDAEVESHLDLRPPKTPSQHLTSDLLLRYVPQIYRRSHGLNPADVLTHRLAHVLRSWPLSGVLAELSDGPLSAPDFGNHAGLWMLYAERLAEHFKPAWVPHGPGREHVELVWTELGKDPALLYPASQAATANEDEVG